MAVFGVMPGSAVIPGSVVARRSGVGECLYNSNVSWSFYCMRSCNGNIYGRILSGSCGAHVGYCFNNCDCEDGSGSG